MKKCSECKVEQDINNYYKDKNRKDGISNRCKKCHNNSAKQHYIKNKKHYIKKANEYYIENKDTILQKQKSKPSYSKLKPGYYKEYRKRNIEKTKKWRNQYDKKRREDVEYNTLNIIKSQIYNFLKNKKGKTTEELLGYKYQDFVDKIGLIDKGYELDHKIPISWFKTGTPISIIWHLENLQITTKEYNRKKHNTHADIISASYYKTVIEWIQEHHLSKIVTYL
jgi:hypothetical protein